MKTISILKEILTWKHLKTEQVEIPGNVWPVIRFSLDKTPRRDVTERRIRVAVLTFSLCLACTFSCLDYMFDVFILTPGMILFLLLVIAFKLRIFGIELYHYGPKEVTKP